MFFFYFKADFGTFIRFETCNTRSWRVNFFLQSTSNFFLSEEFGTSSEKVACEKNCPEPCEHVEFETSFSYNGIQTDTLSEYLLAYLNDTQTTLANRVIYEPLLNMTKSEREKYIE